MGVSAGMTWVSARLTRPGGMTGGGSAGMARPDGIDGESNLLRPGRKSCREKGNGTPLPRRRGQMRTYRDSPTRRATVASRASRMHEFSLSRLRGRSLQEEGARGGVIEPRPEAFGGPPRRRPVVLHLEFPVKHPVRAHTPYGVSGAASKAYRKWSSDPI